MADLGSVGVHIEPVSTCIYEVAAASNISNNPITCVSIPLDRAPKRELWQTFQGFVQDASGAGISRKVLAILRDSEMRVLASTTSSPVDGSFEMKVPFAGDYIVLRLDDVENVVAVDRVEPV